ncbi:hypothetical protein ACHHYP_10472 [Achlya hypogyna]|uniref:Peptidase S74 domain-containing protein n=1 Tax=Achlya hypogyna TaxID=1202772 RepID=A0A1V9ZHT7_ACHHY|nr:hypothetical protein ACHHYP_10472 [Achlya hypogyna]
MALQASSVRVQSKNVTATVATSFEVAHAKADGSSDVTFRAMPDMVISHVPVQAAKVLTPSDNRIKKDVQSIDEDDIYQRLQRLEVKSFKYEDKWSKMMGLGDETIRGVVAQQVAEIFPEYVDVREDFRIDDHGVRIANLKQINKQAIILDLVAALQAQQRRLTLGQNQPHKSGDLALSTAGAGMYANSDDLGSSGDISVKTGDANGGASGGIRISSGAARSGSVGRIEIAGGSGDAASGGAVALTGGNVHRAGSVGGDVAIRSGSGELASSGAVSISTADAGQIGDAGAILVGSGRSPLGKSGLVTMASGDAEADAAGDVHLFAGSGRRGGNIAIAAGGSNDASGGAINVRSGLGDKYSSGDIALRSASSSQDSGNLVLATGDAESQIAMSTGASSTGGAIAISSSGTMSLATNVVSSATKRADLKIGSNQALDGMVSGDVQLSVGASSTAVGTLTLLGGDSLGKNLGGAVHMAAGASTVAGGELHLAGGASSGSSTEGAAGGSVTLTGGAGETGMGGSLTITSGTAKTTRASSGGVTVASGTGLGDTGSIIVASGDTTNGQAGDVALHAPLVIWAAA